MTQEKDKWQKLVRRMEILLRLRSFPVAMKMLEKKEQLQEVPFLRRPENKVSMCQLINLVRNFDWTVGADAEDFRLPTCSSILGLNELPSCHSDGTFRSIVWVQTKEDGKRFEAAIPRIPFGKYEAVAMAPLVYDPFEPDIVLIYGNPAQMILLINALQFEDYEVMDFHCVGESSCSDAIGRCYLTDKPQLSIPCYGERRYGHAQDDELVMALPANYMEKALRGLEVLYRRGVRYPISFAGAEGNLDSVLPVAYTTLEEKIESIRGAIPNGLVAGLTGVIASGKSTVSSKLAQLGARLIDFDLIARQVVEPGKPAYNDAVKFFGTQVCQEDGTLDRKKISDIVFKDMEKRKKLEGFTHPRIYEEFFRQLKEIGDDDPAAIVIVDIPLLVELNLMYLFQKIIVVSVSPKTQKRRLMERDGIDEAEASRIIASQLPVKEKTGFADWVIENDGSMEETVDQVERLCEELKRLTTES
ncbi:dephospho-CoA kinase [delta proteobacterium NaphS2]|nr:dephospho-CoA kinase [delta proteobacterium NaphS2]